MSIRSKLMELEIEKEEQYKAISVLKELRERERTELQATIVKTREESCKTAD